MLFQFTDRSTQIGHSSAHFNCSTSTCLSVAHDRFWKEFASLGWHRFRDGSTGSIPEAYNVIKVASVGIKCFRFDYNWIKRKQSCKTML